MQSIYISKLMELAENDKRILHLIADSGTGYDELFRHNFRTKYIILVLQKRIW